MNPEIEKWQHSVTIGERDQGPEPSTSKADGIAFRLSTAASELFRLVLKTARNQTSRTVFRTLEREYGHLQLWCDGYGALSGELDCVLAESKRLRYLTYQLLASVCETLTDSRFKVALILCLSLTLLRNGGHAASRSR
jgi:hypothetical protein